MSSGILLSEQLDESDHMPGRLLLRSGCQCTNTMSGRDVLSSGVIGNNAVFTWSLLSRKVVATRPVSHWLLLSIGIVDTRSVYTGILLSRRGNGTDHLSGDVLLSYWYGVPGSVFGWKHMSDRWARVSDSVSRSNILVPKSTLVYQVSRATERYGQSSDMSIDMHKRIHESGMAVSRAMAISIDRYGCPDVSTVLFNGWKHVHSEHDV